jgi:hypothetical protein
MTNKPQVEVVVVKTDERYGDEESDRARCFQRIL